LYQGLDWNSRTLVGPFHIVGDCLSEQDLPGLAWLDTALPIRSGDTVTWCLPSLQPARRPVPDAACAPQGEQESTKWYVVIDGVELLVCKYFALRRRPDFHTPFARLVAEVRYPLGWPIDDPAESRRIAAEMRELQANPPQRSDLLVFREHLFSASYAVAEGGVTAAR
jgi:hypothetical protein